MFTLTTYVPITPGYSYTSTTSSTGNAGTGTGNIGFTNRQVYASTSTIYSGGDRTYCWYQVPSAGVWLAQYGSNTCITTSYQYTYLATSPIQPVFGGIFNGTNSVKLDESYLLNDVGLIGNKQLAASGTFSTSSSTYIVLVSNFYMTGTPTGLYAYSLVVTRIA